MQQNSHSEFDPAMFLDAQTSEALATEFVPIPNGLYTAKVERLEAVSGVSARGKPYLVLELHWRIDAPEIELAHNRTVRQGIAIDTNEQGAIRGGQNHNVALGRVRKALGQNVEGQRWTPRMLEGGVARIEVTQRAGDGNYAGQIFNDVKGVAPL